MKAAKPKKVFISYSHANEVIARFLAELMRVGGSRVFRDRDSIAPGKKWRVTIEDSLDEADAILVIWSEESSKSNEVKREYERAVDMGKDVVPILLDRTPLSEVLKEYQYIEFPYLPSPFHTCVAYLAQLVLRRLYEGPSSVDT